MKFFKLLLPVMLVVSLCACDFALDQITGLFGQGETTTQAAEQTNIAQPTPTPETTAAQIDAADLWQEKIAEDKAPDMAAVVKKVLTENPGMDADALAEAVKAAMESGEYELTELPPSDGEALDALEIQLAEALDEVLGEIEIESVSTPWGVLGK